MCGIAGIIGNISEDKHLLIRNMISSLYHRGPDKQKILKTNNSLLAFSRLKIIDFDNRSMQPMISSDKKHILLFNGEIYNYKELKRKVLNKYNFVTESDTEVLLAMLKLYGTSCLKDINGMFAICYINLQDNTYTLARDRFGQKPLYYFKDKNSFYFASEIKSILAAGVENLPDYMSISEYLHNGKIDCYQNTWFKNIKQVEAGTFIKIKDANIISNTKWYDLENLKKLHLPKNLKEKNEIINTTFTKVCNEHLNSDAKIGVKLSGGLDSSTMLAYSEKNSPNLTNKCFSVDFGSSFSEKEWIIETANFFNKKVSLLQYEVNDFVNDYEKMIYTHEGPLGGLMNCAFEKVYLDANNNNIRVLLDGTGLDEAFGGYRVHHLIFLYRMQKNKNFKTYLKDYASKWKIKEEDVNRELNHLSKNSNYVQDGSTFNQNEFTTEYINSLAKDHIHKEYSYNDNIQKHLLNYITCSKIPKNTRIKDRQSMSHSIELRMPFLDQRIIELGLSLEEENYFKGGLTKSAIRNIMKDRLPKKVRLDQKRSIQAPQSQWLANPKIVELILDLLESKSFKSRNIFNYKKIIKSYHNFLNFGSNNTFHIWQWLNVESFFNVYIDKKPKVKKVENIEFTYLN